MTPSAAADQVAIASTGALKAISSRERLPAESAEILPARGTVRRHEAGPNDSPFVLDSSLPPRAAAPSTADDTPFEVDENYTPFVVDDGSAPSASTGPNAASEVQAGVNDSPFVLENQAASKPRAARAPVADSPFVMDTQAPTSQPSANKRILTIVQDKASQSKIAASSKETSAGPFTIVKNGDPKAGPQPPLPATTRMVVAVRAQTTTFGPTTSTPLRFELGHSAIEISSGQRYVPIPGTPFEWDKHESSSLASKNSRRQIELLRPGDKDNYSPPPAALVATAEKPRARLMRNEELPITIDSAPIERASKPQAVPTQASLDLEMASRGNAVGVLPIAPMAPVQLNMQESQVLGFAGMLPRASGIADGAGSAVAGSGPVAGAAASVVGAAAGASPLSAGDAVAAAPLVTSSGHPVAAAVAPVPNAQNELGVSAMLPSPQIGPDVAPIQAQNGTLSAPQAILNSTLGAVMNGTSNGTAERMSAKAVTAKGAVISISLGLLVTIFFLSIVLCLLHAGKKHPLETEEKEPPRPSRSYRQLMKEAQQQSEPTQTVTAAPPSV